jgi:hypothetical protein
MTKKARYFVRSTIVLHVLHDKVGYCRIFIKKRTRATYSIMEKYR